MHFPTAKWFKLAVLAMAAAVVNAAPIEQEHRLIDFSYPSLFSLPGDIVVQGGPYGALVCRFHAIMDTTLICKIKDKEGDVPQDVFPFRLGDQVFSCKSNGDEFLCPSVNTPTPIVRRYTLLVDDNEPAATAAAADNSAWKQKFDDLCYGLNALKPVGTTEIDCWTQRNEWLDNLRLQRRSEAFRITGLPKSASTTPTPIARRYTLLVDDDALAATATPAPADTPWTQQFDDLCHRLNDLKPAGVEEFDCAAQRKQWRENVGLQGRNEAFHIPSLPQSVNVGAAQQTDLQTGKLDKRKFNHQAWVEWLRAKGILFQEPVIDERYKPVPMTWEYYCTTSGLHEQWPKDMAPLFDCSKPPTPAQDSDLQTNNLDRRHH